MITTTKIIVSLIFVLYLTDKATSGNVNKCFNEMK